MRDLVVSHKNNWNEKKIQKSTGFPGATSMGTTVFCADINLNRNVKMAINSPAAYILAW